MFFAVGVALLFAALVIALHHWWIHKAEPPDDGHPDFCLLQRKDFCVFTRFTHETPLLLILVVALICLLLGLCGGG